eukprot:3565796-Pyramimonas_sp.AAC.1
MCTAGASLDLSSLGCAKPSWRVIRLRGPGVSPSRQCLTMTSLMPSAALKTTSYRANEFPRQGHSDT